MFDPFGDLFGGFVSKRCKTLKQAERYQSTLYAKYKTVRLTRWPDGSESGVYEWYVCT